MSQSDLPFELRCVQGVNVVEFREDITDPLDLERANQELHALVEEESRPRVVLDLARVSQINSKLMGLIMGLDVKILRKKGQLRLCSPQRRVQEVFNLTRLSEILQIHRDLQGALTSITPA